MSKINANFSKSYYSFEMGTNFYDKNVLHIKNDKKNNQSSCYLSSFYSKYISKKMSNYDDKKNHVKEKYENVDFVDIKSNEGLLKNQVYGSEKIKKKNDYSKFSNLYQDYHSNF